MGTLQNVSRRDFLKNLAMGAGATVLVGSFGVAFEVQGAEGKSIRGIVVDFTKCTGCRTCETVCSAYNNQVVVNNETLLGLGNPWLANIKVHGFNPDVDVPMVCSRCEDAPCIDACPVQPDPVTSRKALYHHPELGTVTNDPDRCIGCGQCAEACSSLRTGVISQGKDGKPFGMCSLCGGKPQCVEYCPYQALAFVELTDETDFRKLSPQEIAHRLIKEFYGIEMN